MWLPKFEAMAKGLLRFQRQPQVRAYLEEFAMTKRSVPVRTHCAGAGGAVRHPAVVQESRSADRSHWPADALRHKAATNRSTPRGALRRAT
jgi:hypothetical protein